MLGIDARLFGQIVDRVGVKCATGRRLARMVQAGEEAHYEQSDDTIYLGICADAKRLIAWGPILDRAVMAHEYFRPLGEGDNYRYSSKINDVMLKLCGKD